MEVGEKEKIFSEEQQTSVLQQCCEEAELGFCEQQSSITVATALICPDFKMVPKQSELTGNPWGGLVELWW